MAFVTSLLICLVVCGFQYSYGKQDPGDDYPMNPTDQDWTNYKVQHDKHYPAGEDLPRRQIWTDRLQKYNKHNKEYKQGKQTFELGVNQMSDWTEQEISKVLGLKPNAPIGRRKRQATYNVVSKTVVPASVNWTANGWVNPVQDQGYCGSCYAFSSMGALEGQYYNRTRTSAIFSEQNIIDCSLTYGNAGCNGGNMVNAYNYVKYNGIDTAASYPYTSNSYYGLTQNGACTYNSTISMTSVSSYRNIAANSEAALQQAVALVGPISAGITVNTTKGYFQSYKSGVFSDVCDPRYINHAILVVGYGTYNNLPYWLIKNSWGTSWGIQGYMMLARNKNNMCGISSYASFPLI